MINPFNQETDVLATVGKRYKPVQNEELFALKDDVEMQKLLNKLNTNGIIFQLNEKRIADDHKDNPRNWTQDPGL